MTVERAFISVTRLSIMIKSTQDIFTTVQRRPYKSRVKNKQSIT